MTRVEWLERHIKRIKDIEYAMNWLLSQPLGKGEMDSIAGVKRCLDRKRMFYRDQLVTEQDIEKNE